MCNDPNVTERKSAPLLDNRQNKGDRDSRQWEQRKSNASPTMPDLRLVGNVISVLACWWAIPAL